MTEIRFLTILLLYGCGCYAQVTVKDSTAIKPVANENIEFYEDDVKLRVGVGNSFNSFHVKDQNDRLDFTISPNQRIRSVLTITYKFIEFDIGYTPSFLSFNQDDSERGRTKFFNFGTRLFKGHWMQQLQYSRIKGFYVDRGDIGLDSNILFPNLQVSKAGGSTSYIFNKAFSFRSILLQSEWQLKSAGSFVPSISYYYTQIKNTDPSKDHIIDVAAGPAYYYNLVLHKNFLVSAGAYGGVGYNITTTRYNDSRPMERVEGLSLQSQLRLSLGFNSEHFYTGATVSHNSFYYHTDPKIHVSDQQQFVEFYFGYRFKAPEKLRKKVDNLPFKM